MVCRQIHRRLVGSQFLWFSPSMIFTDRWTRREKRIKARAKTVSWAHDTGRPDSMPREWCEWDKINEHKDSAINFGVRAMAQEWSYKWTHRLAHLDILSRISSALVLNLCGQDFDPNQNYGANCSDCIGWPAITNRTWKFGFTNLDSPEEFSDNAWTTSKSFINSTCFFFFFL